MKRLTLICAFALVIAACGSSSQEGYSTTADETANQASKTGANPSYDPNRGEGKFHEVKLDTKLDGLLATNGEKISDLKLLVGSILIIFLPFFTYSFGKHLIRKKKVSWIKLMFFILAMIFIFFLFIILFYFDLQDLFKEAIN